MHDDALRITSEDGGIEVWTVNRPEARNAIDPRVAAALTRAVSAARASRSLRAIVLTGAGDAAFVSGADLKFLRDARAEERAANDRCMTEALESLSELPVPVFGALGGPVIGGGVEVALACDVRIGEPHTTFTVKHVAMGISPGWGGFRRLVACVGRSTAAKLLLTATTMPAEEALRVGLVDELCPKGEALTRALELARAVVHSSPSAVADTKALLSRAYTSEISLDEEQALFVARTVAGDHREALEAFFAKRAPAFAPRGEG
jgi:enoyl-CoA hydratase/carnithine racemase